MAPDPEQAASTLRLPPLVFGIVEVRRLQRELEALDEFMSAMRLRGSGGAKALPRVSRLLDALASDNNMQLLKAEDRKKLLVFLQTTEKSAPTIHISFASDPSSAFLAKVVGWLRQNIDPYALLRVGLQPNIAAGCVVRTSNKWFDFSLRNRFGEHRDMLLQSMDRITQDTQPQLEATPQPAGEPS